MITVSLSGQSGFEAQFNQRLNAVKDPSGLLQVVGRELANRLKTHFRKKDQNEPNRLSTRRQHFWLQVASSVNAPKVQGRSVSVRISDPRIAQKVFGGEIRAKRAGALTIPVNEKAYGRTAATFERETGLKLFLLNSPGKAPVLAAKVGGQIEVEYVLRKSVNQAPTPGALPDQGELERAILARADAFVKRTSE